jgi:hypothetical protein
MQEFNTKKSKGNLRNEKLNNLNKTLAQILPNKM